MLNKYILDMFVYCIELDVLIVLEVRQQLKRLAAAR